MTTDKYAKMGRGEARRNEMSDVTGYINCRYCNELYAVREMQWHRCQQRNVAEALAASESAINHALYLANEALWGEGGVE